MKARTHVVLGAAIALLGLAACGGPRSGDKTEQSSAERVAAALDVCGEGQGEFAAFVCADETLAALDAEARTALVEEAALVSDAGAQLLVQNQIRWREAQRISCGVADVEAAITAEQRSCLESQFSARAREAGEIVQEMGGYTFQRMELIDAFPVTVEMADASGMGAAAPAAIIREIRFPRIDGRQTPEIQRFNDLAAQGPQYRIEDATNEIVGYEIAYAGPELISVRFDLSSDTLGAAHPNNTSQAVTVLMNEGRALAAEDVFQPGSQWEDFLTRRAVAAITQQYRDDGFTPPERDVRESATKPHLWLVTERGLTIVFPPYSFGAPYVMGGTEVTISWRDLRPYLNPAAPAPIRAAV